MLGFLEDKCKKIVIFGAGKNGLVIANALTKVGINNISMVDNDINRIGEKICGIEVSSPNILSSMLQKDIYIFISCKQYECEIRNQLEKYGHKENIYNIFEEYALWLDDFSENNIDVKFSAKPKVTVALTTYNQWNYTYNCLHSFVKRKTKVQYSILIGDNNSNDRTTEIEGLIPNASIIHRQENIGYLRNVNETINCAKSDYVLLIQNDTAFISDYWLDSIVDYMDGNVECGCISPSMLSFDQKNLYMGGWINSSGIVTSFTEYPKKEMPFSVMYVQPACLLIRKSLWDEIGGFDDKFIPAWCEDEDFYLNVMKKGYKVMVDPRVAFIHFGAMTCGLCPSIVHQEHLKILLSEWGDYLTDTESNSIKKWKLLE